MGKKHFITLIYWITLMGIVFLMKDAGKYTGLAAQLENALFKSVLNTVLLFYPATLLLQAILKRLDQDRTDTE